MHEQLFESELEPNESILWTGKPIPEIRLKSVDAILIPIGLLFLGLGILLIVRAAGSLDVKNLGTTRPFLAPVGLLLILGGSYLSFFRLLAAKRRKLSTYYALTNLRALVLYRCKRDVIRSVLLNSVPSLSRSTRADGTGTIYFGKTFPMLVIADTAENVYLKSALSFRDIPKVDEVFSLAQDTKLGMVVL